MIAYILVGVVVLAIISHIVYNSYSILRSLINYFFKDYINRHLLFRNLKPKHRAILQSAFTYYNKLDEKNKRLFERRVRKFIDMKVFIPRGGIEKITDEMKVLIAAAAVQITFGFPGVYFEHFWRILVYPDNYYSTITQRYHKGEVNTRGFIVLSWKNFVSGYIDQNDGRNLGLHEMAHALRIENAIRNEEYDFLDFEMLKKFTRLGKEEQEKIRRGESTFFREYAADNDHEFFAVAIENFFERPAELKAYSPEIYDALTKLLLQDPV